MAKRVEARHFYLNEQHELSRVERDGGGSLPKFGEMDWAGKQRRLTKSLARTRKAIDDSSDPLRGKRYFLLARPETTVPKLTENKRKSSTGHFDEAVDYGGKDGRVLGRLGLDVIAVSDAGALVHASPERFGRLEAMAPILADLGRAEQARWAYVADFDPVPPELRADEDWLEEVRRPGRHEAIVELQPLLSRSEGALVMNAIAGGLRRADEEAILATGTDFSGRAWIRASLLSRTISRIVKEFFSVQAVHGPLLSHAMADTKRRAVAGLPVAISSAPFGEFPVVAVVDTGVAKNHPQLEQLRRGTYVSPQSAGVFEDHGTFVTSRVVFGDPSDPFAAPPSPSCRFLDVVVAQGPKYIDDKIVVNAIEAAAANYPDVRVFNLSFGDYVATELRSSVERTQRLFLTQDLDNLIFSRDLLVVIAAGNSREGVIPSNDYPEHWQDPSWGVGHWAGGFNSVKCGSFAREWTLVGGLADVPYAPSPFCRTGPGVADAPVPDFAEHGGNCTPSYRFAAGLGVWGLASSGMWEDRCGTSHAAPILARECAFTIRALQPLCPPGSHPFASTVKAVLALTSAQVELPPRFKEVAARTLGLGVASHRAVSVPENATAIFVWQGVLSHKNDIARVVVPVPKAWLLAAGDPVCDVAVAWDTPVNAASPSTYGCRRVDFKLKPNPDGEAVRGGKAKHPGYPLRVRTYSLKKVLADESVELEDIWTVELGYEESCDYPPTQTFSPEQRVSFALRLRDRAGIVSPQAAVQALEVTQTMTRLSATEIPAQIPVTLKNQG